MGNNIYKYKVQEGDTPSSISKKFEIPLDSFYTWNPGLNENNLKKGKEYFITNPVPKKIGDKFHIGFTKFGRHPIYDSPTGNFNEIYKLAKENGDEAFYFDRNRNGEIDDNEFYSTDYKVYWKVPHAKSQEEYAKKIWDYLINEEHLTKEQASAIMGNAMQESGMGAYLRQKNGDNAVGVLQLHGQNLIEKNKMFKDDPIGDIKYLLYILKNPVEADWRLREYNRIQPIYQKIKDKKESELTDQDKKYIDYWNKTFKGQEDAMKLPWSEFAEIWNNNSTDLNKLTEAITKYFEKAGKPEQEKRNGYALTYYNSYGQIYKFGGKMNYIDFLNIKKFQQGTSKEGIQPQSENSENETLKRMKRIIKNYYI